MVMRATIIILLCGLSAGCASKSENIASTTPAERCATIRHPSASALVFDWPTRSPFEIDLQRHDPAVAYLGYETVNLNSTWIRQDDQFRGDEKNQSRFNRRAVSSQIIERVR